MSAIHTDLKLPASYVVIFSIEGWNDSKIRVKGVIMASTTAGQVTTYAVSYSYEEYKKVTLDEFRAVTNNLIKSYDL